MLNQKYKPPMILLPEGSDVWIGLASGIATLVWLHANNYLVCVQFLAPFLVMLFVWYVLRTYAESYRLYQKSMQMLKTIRDELGSNVTPYLNEIRDSNSKGQLKEGYKNLQDIVATLSDKKPGVMYGGFSEVLTQVTRLGGLIPQFVNVQNNPRLAGAKANQTIQEGQEAITGFRDWSTEMLTRVASEQIFSMTTNARMLRSLRNLLGQKLETGAQS